MAGRVAGVDANALPRLAAPLPTRCHAITDVGPILRWE